MIILECIIMITKICFLVAFTFVLFRIFQILTMYSKYSQVFDRLKKVEEKLVELVREQANSKAQNIGYGNDIERLKKSLSVCHENDNKLAKKRAEDQKTFKDFDRRLKQCENKVNVLDRHYQEKILVNLYEKSKDTIIKENKIKFALGTSEQKPRKIALKSLKPEFGETYMFVESSDGALVITADRNDEICVIPGIEILRERDFKYQGIAQCFNTNRDVESGETYKIVTTKEPCILESDKDIYRVKVKGKIEIEPY